MKKKFLATVAMLATACMMITACGNSGSTDSAKADVDINTLAQDITSQVEFSEELTQLDTDLIGNYVTVEDGVESVMYVSSGTSAEEVAVFATPDEETAGKMKDNVQSFLDDQYDSFKDYIPEAADRVKNASVKQYGRYVVLCVADDTSKAEEVADAAFAN